MPGAAARIAHVVEAVEHGDQVELAFVDLLGGDRLEADPVAEPVGLGMGVRLLDRGGVEVVADEAAGGESLGHEKGGEAYAATDVRDLGSRLQARQHPVERGQPGLDDRR